MSGIVKGGADLPPIDGGFDPLDDDPLLVEFRQLQSAVAQQIELSARIEAALVDARRRPAVAPDPETLKVVQASSAKLIAASNAQAQQLTEILTAARKIPATADIEAAATDGAKAATSAKFDAAAAAVKDGGDKAATAAAKVAEAAEKLERQAVPLNWLYAAVCVGMLTVACAIWVGWMLGTRSQDVAIMDARNEVRREMQALVDAAQALADKTPEVVKWANSAAGKQARQLAKGGSVQQLLDCSARGWRKEERAGGLLCFPFVDPADGEVTGWWIKPPAQK